MGYEDQLWAVLGKSSGNVIPSAPSPQGRPAAAPISPLFVYMWKGRPETQHSSVRGRDEAQLLECLTSSLWPSDRGLI